jgi:hypothetical protein
MSLKGTDDDSRGEGRITPKSVLSSLTPSQRHVGKMILRVAFCIFAAGMGYLLRGNGYMPYFMALGGLLIVAVVIEMWLRAGREPERLPCGKCGQDLSKSPESGECPRCGVRYEIVTDKAGPHERP